MKTNRMRIGILMLASVLVIMALSPVALSAVNGWVPPGQRNPSPPPAHGITLTTEIRDIDTGVLLAADHQGRIIANYPYVSVEFLADLLDGVLEWDRARRVAVIETDMNWELPEPEPVPEPEDLVYALLNATEPDGMLVFTVTNSSSQSLDLTFASGKSWDVVIYSGTTEVWRLSGDKEYVDLYRQEELTPDQVLTYVTDIPQLPAGRYRAYAYFYGVDADKPVAEVSFEVEPLRAEPRELAYDLQVVSTAIADVKRIEFEISNPHDVAIGKVLPTTQTMDLIIKSRDRTVWRHSDGINYLQVETNDTIAANAARRHRVTLPELRSGTYELYAYFWDFDRPAARLRFTVN